MQRMFVGVVALILLGAAGRSAAGPVAVTFSGQILAAGDDTGPGGVLPAWMGVGSAFALTVTYDTDASAVPGEANPFYGFLGWSMTVGGQAITPPPAFYIGVDDILVADDHPSWNDTFIIWSQLDPSRHGEAGRFQIVFLDENESALSDDRLPSSFDLGLFQTAHFYLTVGDVGVNGVSASANGRITEISVTAVPEPGSLALLASAGFGLLAVARRRRGR